MSNPPPPDRSPSPFDGPNLVTAPAGIRLGAKLIDVLVLFVPIVIINALLGVGTLAQNVDVSIARRIMALVAGQLAVIAYFVITDGSGGSVGKRVLNLRVIGADGHQPTSDEALRRNAYLFLGLFTWMPQIGPLLRLIELGLLIGIGVTITNDAANRGLHDKFAGGTTVVRITN